MRIPLLPFLIFSCAASAADLSTQDGLTLSFDSLGRAGDLRVRGQSVAGKAAPGGLRLCDLQAQQEVEAKSDAAAKLGLKCEWQPRAHRDHLAFEGRVIDERRGGDRAIDVIFRVPFDPPSGTIWWPDITGPRRQTEVAIKLGRLGSPQCVLTFSPVRAKRFRLYQPAQGGCGKRPGMLWVAEAEAYGRDQNENLLRSDQVKMIRCDSSSGKYSIERVTDGVLNDRWDKNWIRRGWASENNDRPHWIEVELVEEVELARLDVYWCRERFGFATSQKFWLERWDGTAWQRVEAAVSHEKPRLGDAEKAQFMVEDKGTSTEVYPFGCVTDKARGLGIGLAIPPDSPCVFQIEHDTEARCLALTFKFGLSSLPRNPQLKSQAPFRFVLFRVDGRWGFRDAARRYYALFPRLFERVTKLDGLWMLGNPTAIPNPHHYAYREHGEKQADLDELWGIYTCPYVLVGQREIMSEAKGYDEAMAALARTDPALRSYYGPGLKGLIDNCSLRTSGGRHVMLRRRRGGSINGPAVVTFPMNPDPSLYEGTGRKVVARHTLTRVADTLAAFPKVDGIYVDSLSSWGGFRNARREHFEFVDLPLTHDKQGNVVIDNAIAHIEFLRALRAQMPSRDKIIFGNGIRKRRAWAGFVCDVGGVEANRSVHRDPSHYAFFRTIAYHKPFLLLYYYDYPKMNLPRHGVSEYVQSAIAFGIAPETRPFAKERERDVDLYNTFIPVLRKIGQAGWEPVTHARASDEALWLERFGTGTKGLFFTAYNPTMAAKSVEVAMDLDALGYGAGLPVTEIVERTQMGLARSIELDVPAKSLRVLQIGDAPEPLTPPVLAPGTVAAKLLSMREEKWRGAGGLLINGGLEVLRPDGRLLAWRMGTGDTGELRVDAEEPHGGERCVYFRDDDAESWADVVQVFPYIDEADEYILSLWVKQATKSKHSGRVYFQWRGDEGKIKQGRHNFTRSQTWKKCEWRMVPPPGARSLSMAIGIAKRDSGELWIDDISLVRKRRESLDSEHK